jgi:hypothetical protein
VLQKPFERLFGTVSSGAEYVHKDRVSGWRTTGVNGIIEFWYNGYSGAFANTGRHHAELNADSVSALYQDIDTIPGMLLYWALAHRGRAGVDVMECVPARDGRTAIAGRLRVLMSALPILLPQAAHRASQCHRPAAADV